MPRAKDERTLLGKSNGNVVVLPEGTAEYRTPGGTLIDLFDSRENGSPVSNPVTADSNGRVVVYFEPQRFRVRIKSADSSVDQTIVDELALADIVSGGGVEVSDDAPSPTEAGDLWLDTSNGERLRIRNSDNDAWFDGAWRYDDLVLPENRIVNVPSDYGSLQAAFDGEIHWAANGSTITVNIQSGHQPTLGIELEDGDWRHFRITSDDSTVTLSSSFPSEDHFISLTNAAGPTLDALVDADGNGDVGIELRYGSYMRVLEDRGVINAGGDGLFVAEASDAVARESNFAGAGGSAVVVTRIGRAELNNANISNAGTHGLFAINAAFVNALGANANDAGQDGLRAFQGAQVNAQNATATNAGNNGVSANSGGYMNARNVDASGADNSGCISDNFSRIFFRDGNAQKGGSPDSSDIQVFRGGMIGAEDATGGTNIATNTLTNNGIIWRDD